MTLVQKLTNHSGRTTGVGNSFSKELSKNILSCLILSALISPDGNRVTIFTHLDV